MKLIKLFALSGLLAFCSVGFLGTTAHALSLKLSPLEYRTSLEKGEKKKGFIDVSNPNLETVKIRTQVQAFRQTDSSGSLRFYDNEQVSAGIQLDLKEFELKPREALRMYFLIDGTKLPKGDVYGAIFFISSDTFAQATVTQQVRLGTLLSIVNETPGSREAVVERLNTNIVQFDTHTRGSFVIKNTSTSETTGFYPEVTLKVWPFGKEQRVTSRLVFAGLSRSTDFDVTTPPFGIYRVTASFGTNLQSRWVIVLNPVAIVIIAVLLTAFALTVYRRRRGPKRSKFHI